ncbi:SusC/RagA family TonB-linked outer membrane protein [Mucilaginibacter xinganensis]|uniref:TonB-linked outer membrane protein, SusC/RagA family n=1 Tax=Mucilaginibacter xinganensis TaxID=1234841 RepID=A0A223NS99_9SPHI|nr:TonB-dependent receptor [Mucilaginibacter xinganensis]ASU32538.1 TonB-linked outer membrane protein, SusC/RagA family [Mucilaginibacter xinganensis]
MKKLVLAFLCFSMLCITQVFAQSHSVTGVVTGKDDGKPIPGATLRVKGQNSGSQTDVNGKFSLTVPDNATLSFSFLGYLTQDVSVAGKSSLTVVLVPSNRELDEVVVTGYQTKTRANNTAAISTISPKEIADKPIPGIDNLLQGKAAGVQITTENGRPGANAFIRIRGTGSVNASQQPLLVVDGVQIPDAAAPEFYNTLNANDVANISVLKDASASSLYGARGSNGVVVITTKNGSESSNHISYTFQYGTNRKIPDNFQMMSAAQKLQYEYDLGYTNGDLANYLSANNLPTDVTQITDAQRQTAFNALIAQSHNWQDDILRSGKIMQHQLVISGHENKTNYYASFQKYDEDGIVVGSNLNKYNGKLNLSTEVKPYLTLSNNLSLGERSTNETRDRYNAQNPFYAIYAYNPYEKVYNADGSYNLTSQGFPILEALKNNPENQKYLNGYNTTTVDFHPIKGLSISSQIGLTLNDYTREYFIKPGSILDNYVGDPAAPGDKTDNGSRDFNYDWINKAIYRFDVNSDHHFTILGVQEFQKDVFTSYTLESKGFPSPDLPTQDNASANSGKNSTSYSAYTIASLLGEVDYNYKGKYFVTGSIRNDGSSRFGANNRYGTFGAGSIGWLITSEDFAKNITWLNVLKLRASIGNTGNFSGISNYQALGLYGFGNYGGKSTAIPTQIPNPNLTWEKKLKRDVGIDFELFNSRITGSFEYYNETTSGLLFQLPVSQTTGFSAVYKNVGGLYNKGIDLSLNGDIVRNKDVKWSVYGNINYNKNKVTSLYSGANEIASNGVGVVKPGEAIYTYKVVRYAGVNSQTGAAQFLDKNGNITETYNFDNAVVESGKSPNPKFYGGFGTSVSYKGFELTADFTYSYGGYTYNNVYQNLDAWGSNYYQAQSTLALNYWKKPGDVNVLPKPDAAGADQTYVTDQYLQKDDYIRFRTLQLAYTLPKAITQKFKVYSLRVFLQGQNLLTINPHHFFGDPEVGIGSVESGLLIPGQNTLYSYPSTRQFTFGANITF